MSIFNCCRGINVKSNNLSNDDGISTIVSQPVVTQQVMHTVGPQIIMDKHRKLYDVTDIIDQSDAEPIEKKNNNDYSIERLFNDIVIFQEKIITSDEFNKADKNFMKIKKFNAPQILCVGTQTSGKSSLVNNIIGYELLPTGDNMVTRTPLNVSLTNGPSNTLTLFYIENGKKFTTYRCKFSECDIPHLQNQISEATDAITGGKFLISPSILYLEIVSLNVEDMVIIDLPGLITIARTKDGQPESMVNDIKELIKSQLTSNRVFVIAVIQSKVDLETDAGLGLIKELGGEYKMETIGVLTKPDLLDQRSLAKFENIFLNNIVEDLQVDNGYYVINNFKPNDAAWYASFFGKKSAIITQKKYGVFNFKQAIKKHIGKFLKGHSHEVRKDLIITRNFLMKNRPSLNNTVEESSSKLLYMITVTYILHRILCESFNSTGNMVNIGGNIRDIFESFTYECNNMDPFNKNILSDEKLNQIIKNFDGYLPSHTKKINLIVNKCIADEDTQPIKKIMRNVDKCVNTLIETIMKLTKSALAKSKVDIYPYELNSYNVNMQEYPKLIDFVLDKTTEIFDKYTKNTLLMINSQLSIHEISAWVSKTDIEYVQAQAMNELTDDMVNNLENEISKVNDIDKNKSTLVQFNEHCECPSIAETSKPDINQHWGNDLISANSSMGSQQISETSFKKATKMNSDEKNQSIKNNRSNQYMSIYGEPSYTPTEVRIFLNVIFKNIVKQIGDIVIKTITALILKEFENKYFIEITQIINKMKNMEIDTLFYASTDLIREKKKYNELLDEVTKFIDCIDKL